jgi:hypothetical protein
MVRHGDAGWIDVQQGLKTRLGVVGHGDEVIGRIQSLLQAGLEVSDAIRGMPLRALQKRQVMNRCDQPTSLHRVPSVGLEGDVESLRSVAEQRLMDR